MTVKLAEDVLRERLKWSISAPPAVALAETVVAQATRIARLETAVRELRYAVIDYKLGAKSADTMNAFQMVLDMIGEP